MSFCDALVFTLLFACVDLAFCYLKPSKTINLKQGLVQGNYIELLNGDKALLGKSLEIFRGIPYAAPPVGSLRFLPPVTGTSWKGIKNTTEFSPVCPQQLPETTNRTKALLKMTEARYEEIVRIKKLLVNQSEDCLYLNVYVPFRGKFKKI